MSVTINWSFTNYSDVESVLICRSEVLDSEKAFEDSLNGITQTSFPDIIGSAITSDLTEGLQSFTDLSPLTPSTTYYYCVAAKGLDSDGLFKVGPTSADASSSPVTGSADGSSSVSVVTTAAESGGGGADTTAPQTPTGLVAVAGDGEVTISWNANSETDLAGYNVYKSQTSGSGYNQITTPTQTSSSHTGLRDSSVTNGTQYFYKISAEDTTGNVSDYSSEVSATPQAAGGGGGGGAGSDPNILVGYAFADLLGSYKALYGDMPPTEAGESYPGINFYNDVFADPAQLDLVNLYYNSESILLTYIEVQLTSNQYITTYGAINDVPLFGSTERANYENRIIFVKRHLLNKGYGATTYQKDQAAKKLYSYFRDGMTEYQAIAYFLYNLGTEPVGDNNTTYIVYTSPQIETYRTTANNIGVEANAPWSSP